jgi:hypothetical protein
MIIKQIYEVTTHFFQNENSLFLTRVAQAHSQLNLIENLVLNGTSTNIIIIIIVMPNQFKPM